MAIPPGYFIELETGPVVASGVSYYDKNFSHRKGVSRNWRKKRNKLAKIAKASRKANRG